MATKDKENKMKNIWHKGTELPTIDKVGQENDLVVVLADEVFGGYYEFECGVFVPYYTESNEHLHGEDCVCYTPDEVIKWCKFSDLNKDIEQAPEIKVFKKIEPLQYKYKETVEVVDKLNEIIALLNGSDVKCDNQNDKALKTLREVQNIIRKVNIDSDPTVTLMEIDALIFQAIGEEKDDIVESL